MQGLLRTPNGIRTRATAVKGRRPRPLDDGGLDLVTKFNRERLKRAKSTRSAESDQTDPTTHEGPEPFLTPTLSLAVAKNRIELLTFHFSGGRSTD